MPQYVLERFPDRAAEIVSPYLRDPVFRGLCHDYGVCVEEASKLAVRPAKEGFSLRTSQFAELQAELESEIVEYLDRNGTHGKGSRQLACRQSTDEFTSQSKGQERV